MHAFVQPAAAAAAAAAGDGVGVGEAVRLTESLRVEPAGTRRRSTLSRGISNRQSGSGTREVS